MAKTANEAIGADAKLDPVFARALREALFWLLAALALVLLIALASYRPGRSAVSAYTGEPGAGRQPDRPARGAGSRR